MFVSTTLTMGNIVGHSIEFIFSLTILRIILWMNTSCQPMILNIKGPCCRLHNLYWITNSVLVIQELWSRGREWIYITRAWQVHDVGHNPWYIKFTYAHIIQCTLNRPISVDHNNPVVLVSILIMRIYYGPH